MKMKESHSIRGTSMMNGGKARIFDYAIGMDGNEYLVSKIGKDYIEISRKELERQIEAIQNRKREIPRSER